MPSRILWPSCAVCVGARRVGGAAGLSASAGRAPAGPGEVARERERDASSTLFTTPPDWGWLIVCYFFLGGIAGGGYVLAALIDLFGAADDRPLARLGYYIAFPLVVRLRAAPDRRPQPAGAVLAHADPVRDLPADVQVVVADVRRLVGAPLFGGFSFVSFLGCPRRAGPTAVAGAARASARPGCSGCPRTGLGGDLRPSSWPATPASCSRVTNRPIWADTNLLGLAVPALGRLDRRRAA